MITNRATEGLEFRRIRRCDDPLFAATEALFMASFPVEERRPAASLHRAVQQEERFSWWAVIEHDEAVGLLAHWDFPKLIYVEYLAVRADQRGRGVGSRLMENWLKEQTRPVVLEVEPPTDAERRRRVAFYEHLGFVLLPDPYEQPSYGVAPGLPLRLMRRGETTLTAEQIARTLYHEVYHAPYPPRG